MKRCYVYTPAALVDLPDSALRERFGGKALGLVQLLRAELAVPAFFVIDVSAFQDDGALTPSACEEVVTALRELGPGPFAVRSSAVAEDGRKASFAGQFESFLWLSTVDDVLDAISRCRRSGDSARVSAYRALHGLPPTRVGVIVQRLVQAEAAGVAFSATPEAPEHVVISATVGLADRLVDGEAAADTWYVDGDGQQIARIEPKTLPGSAMEITDASLSEALVGRIASVARSLAAAHGHAVDLEFAVRAGQLWFVQLRPVTAPVPGGRRMLWDNSNIVESFSGVTTPMTFSFASRCYAQVYAQFCRAMGVPAETVEANAPVFARMIGFIRGRVYYNLNAWYLALSLLPGFALTRKWMEQMMGVRERAGDRDALADRQGKLGAGADAARLILRLGWRGLRLDGDAERFRAQVRAQLEKASGEDYATMDPATLVDRFAALERELLGRWTTPIVNDFFLMIFHGALRQLCARWGGADGAQLANGLMAAEGVESAEPLVECARLADVVRGNAYLTALFEGDLGEMELLEAAREVPVFEGALQRYLERFGDRCADELKLEVPTLKDRPEFLVGAIRAALVAPPASGRADPAALRRDTEAKLFARVRGVKALVLRALLKRARRRMRDRESLRFLRTRVFALVRRLFHGAGEQLARTGALAAPSDVWMLSVDEVLGYLRGTAVSWDLKGQVELRRAEHTRWLHAEPPAERFHTLGAPPVHNQFRGAPAAAALAGAGLSGVPCCPGLVEAGVRVVRDISAARELRGQILAAERTDPGWVPLFSGIAGLLVERGSVLSHSAVVARELGIPTIVGIRGLTRDLTDGARVRMDGARGTVERL